MPHNENLPNRLLGNRYELKNEIDKGGMGVVYNAWDSKLKCHVAIKLSLWEFDDDRMQRFIREAQVMTQLKHPHIIRVRDYDISSQSPYIVMDLLENPMTLGTLFQLNVPQSDLLNYLIQIADALDYAYREKKVIHRDVKPDNILIDARHKMALLTDFGIALAVDEEQTGITPTNQLMGTESYRSPEQASGRVVDHRTDIYALGIILHEILTGRRPYTKTPHVDDFKPIPSVRTVDNTIPIALANIVSKALEKEPGNRFNTAGDFAAALRKATDQQGGDKSKLVIYLAVATIAALVVLAGFIILFDSGAEPTGTPVFGVGNTTPAVTPGVTNTLAVAAEAPSVPTSTPTVPPTATVASTATEAPNLEATIDARITAIAQETAAALAAIPTATPIPTSAPTTAPTATATPLPPPDALVVQDGLNIRYGPGTVYASKGQLQAGTPLEISQRSAGWYEVTAMTVDEAGNETEIVGWVSGEARHIDVAGNFSETAIDNVNFSFAGFHPEVWQNVSNADIALTTSGSTIRAQRNLRLSDWESATVSLIPLVNWRDPNQVVVTWETTINQNARRNLIYMRLVDVTNNQWLGFDCSVGDTRSSTFNCVTRMSGSQSPRVLHENIVQLQSLDRDRSHTFQIQLVGERTVAFLVNGQAVGQVTFNATEWRNMDQVKVDWVPTAWGGFENRVDATLFDLRITAR